MKRKAVFVIVGILALMLGFVFSSKTGPRGIIGPTSAPTPRTASFPPQITIIPGVPTTIDFSSIKIPATENVLPVFSYSKKTTSASESASIARRVGFSSIPLKTSTKNTTTYKWTDKTASLVFIEQSGENRWVFGQGDKPVFSHGLITSAAQAKNFIEKTFPPSANSCSLVLAKESTGQFDGIVSLETLRGFYFSCQTPNGQTIVNSSFGEISALLIINQAGVVRSIMYGFVVDVGASHERPILTTEEAVYNIQHGKGVLISLGRERAVSFFDEIPSFQEVLFSSFSYIYYPNKGALLLEPYYIFTGTTKAGGENLIIKYAVSAMESY